MERSGDTGADAQAAASFLGTWIRSFFQPDRRPRGINRWNEPPKGRVPVVLIHGTWMNSYNTWEMLAPRLAAAGHAVFCFDYGRDASSLAGRLPGVHGTRGLLDSRAEVADFIDEVLERTGARQVDLVAHSQGVAQARMYLTDSGGADAGDPARNRVRRVVGLGGSNHGTYSWLPRLLGLSPTDAAAGAAAGSAPGTGTADQAELGPADQAKRGPADEAHRDPEDETERGPADKPDFGQADKTERGPADEAERGSADKTEHGPADRRAGDDPAARPGTRRGRWARRLLQRIGGQAALDQLVGSPAMAHLNRYGDTVPGVEYTMLCTRYDTVVTPWRTQFLEAGPGARVRNVVVQQGALADFSDHLAMLYSPHVIDLVLEALSDDAEDYRAAHPAVVGTVLPFFGALPRRLPRVRLPRRRRARQSVRRQHRTI
ncbi:esterase/lipase family protein [Corynebacterium frankenforstense]